MLAPVIVALLSFLLAAPSSALILPIRIHHSGMSRFDVNSSDPFTFENVFNATSAGSDIYVGNLTVGGHEYEVCTYLLTLFFHGLPHTFPGSTRYRKL
jgi:hypothetical protein